MWPSAIFVKPSSSIVTNPFLRASSRILPVEAFLRINSLISSSTWMISAITIRPRYPVCEQASQPFAVAISFGYAGTFVGVVF